MTNYMLAHSNTRCLQAKKESTEYFSFSFLVCLVCFFVISFSFFAHAETAVPLPKGMDAVKDLSKEKTQVLIEQLNAFLGIHYRNDGAINKKGEYTLFADEAKQFDTPGLNCSGFVLGASRFLLNDNISIVKAKNDRLGDSGPGSSLGEDWDFGWNIIQNIAEGRGGMLLLPQGGTTNPFTYNGLQVPSFDFHAKGVWDNLLTRIKPNMVYLLSFNKPSTIPGYTMQHYHVALMVREGSHIWMYQTTTQSKKVYRRDMSNAKEKSDFLKAFANKGNIKKKIAIIEVPLSL